MANLPPYSDSTDDKTSVTPNRGPTFNTPLWVKVFGIVIIILVVLIGIMLLTGSHEPGRHAPVSDIFVQISLIEYKLQQL
jgi:hypothetical protein